jgi:hypothetical protein
MAFRRSLTAVRVRPAPADRAYPRQPILLRATAVVGASYLAVCGVLDVLAFDDGWAGVIEGSLYLSVWIGIPALALTLAAWAIAAWYIDVTVVPKGTLAWLGAVACGLLPAVMIAFEGSDFDPAPFIVAAPA